MPVTSPRPSTLQVILDVGPAVHQGAGLSRYAGQLARHLLAEAPPEMALTFFYNAHSGHDLPQELAQAPRRTLPLNQYAWRLSVLASQLLGIPYPGILPRSSPDSRPILYHATEHLLPYLPVPKVLTVHDLIFERYPQHHTWTNRLFLRVGMPLFVRRADAIIAVSRHTQRDLMELYRVPPAKIHLIYQGIDPAFRPAPPAEVQRIRQRYSPDRPYLLMVGTLEPRKNHATALRALLRLKQAGHPHRLLVVGGRGWLFEPIQEEVKRLGLEGDVTFAGYVPGADLPPLYTGADCVLMPSLYEGFGFPVLEAMACGAPVVCSQVSSLPEVAGDVAMLVPPTDDAALAAAVGQILQEPERAAAMRTQGPVYAARFRWDECARQTVALYQALAQKSKPSSRHLPS